MSMVFCKSCGKEIHETAVTCPHCGAPQGKVITTAVANTDTDTSEVNAFDWFVIAIKKYAVFTGRARRKEYWFFVLFTVLISIGLKLIENTIGVGEILSGLFSLGTIVPGIAVGIRRMHDTNRSGWWLLINLIPIIGAIIFIVFAATDGDASDNQYGPNPKLE